MDAKMKGGTARGRMLVGLPIFAVLCLGGRGGRPAPGRGGASDRGVAYGDSSLQVVVEPGTEWLHDFPLFLGLKRRNPPQMAIWIESPEGVYLATVYVTRRIASQSWRMAGGNRRREARPHWWHRRGVRYADGLYLPTREEPLPDAVSGATPRGGFEARFVRDTAWGRFVMKVEVNHSTDFNDTWPRSAREGEAGWTGGRYGSGQPALVSAAVIAPDGSDGRATADFTGLTSALRIIDRVVVRLPPVSSRD